MKAIQMHGYGGVDQLRYEDVPAPTAGPSDVLVKVAATSVNPFDWKLRRGDLKEMLTLHFPVIPGSDVAGEVVAVGAGVFNFKPGQKVMALTNHTYAELVVVSSADLAMVPDGLELQQAGALPVVTTTGAELMEHVAPQSGQTVLVYGGARRRWADCGVCRHRARCTCNSRSTLTAEEAGSGAGGGSSHRNRFGLRDPLPS